MTSPQPGIFVEGSSHFYYLEYELNGDVAASTIQAAIKAALSQVIAGVEVVVCFGRKAWKTLHPAWAPAELVDFETLKGVQDFAMPSTQGDVFFWLHGNNHDDVFDSVVAMQQSMQAVANLNLDLRGFDYRNQHDLIGFEDGTANPKADDRMLAALIPDGEVGAGGSYVLSQKWVHDLPKFNALSVPAQERVVGRTKVENIEFEGDAMPADSHVSRTDAKVDGVAMKIYRRSDPFGSAREHGLYFLAFACEMRRFTVQLDRMLGVTADGVHDRLMEFSKAQTNSYWFAPSANDLAAALN